MRRVMEIEPIKNIIQNPLQYLAAKIEAIEKRLEEIEKKLEEGKQL